MTRLLLAQDVAVERASRNETVHRLKALVVDDDNVSRTLLVKILRHLGHEVVSAESAEQALAIFEKEDPQLVLMDIVLPGMDGVQALQLMKKARGERWLPVILVSVRDASSEVLLGLRAGADDYLTKPIAFDQVAAKLHNLAQSLTVHAQLQSSLRFTRAVMDHILDGLLCVDERGKILASNPAAERLFGFGAGQLIGRDFDQVAVDGSPDSVPHGSGIVGRSYGTGVRLDGSHFQFEAQRSRVPLDARTIIVMTLRDIDQQLDDERRILNDSARLREYHAEREAENELGRQMLDRLLLRDKVAVPNVAYRIEAATGFSGDVVAALRSPSGKLFVMMADATGHGLAAAISLVPALSVLHAMVERDCSLAEIVKEMNSKLCQLTPVDRFLASTIVRLDETTREGQIWVGGMPAVTLIDEAGRAQVRFESRHAPMGISPSSAELAEPECFSWSSPVQLVMISDGVLEAESPFGEQFGEQRLLAAFSRVAFPERLACVSDAMKDHLAGFAARDDASIAVIDLA